MHVLKKYLFPKAALCMNSNDSSDDFAVSKDRRYVDARLRWGEVLLLRFVDYRQVLLHIVNQFLGAVSLFSLPFLWLLGTRFQDIFAPSTQRIYRSVACVMLLILLPSVIIVGCILFASVGGYVQGKFKQLEESTSHSTDGKTSADCSEDDSTVALRRQLQRLSADELQRLNDLRGRFLDESSLPGFLARIVGSWGGILMAIQFLASRAGAKRIETSIWRRLIPNFDFVVAATSRLKLLFTDPEDDPGDARAGQANEGTGDA